MSLSIGIVGLPNVGKSTLFTALTKKGGLAANYPFATIDPNVGIVDVPDERLRKLADIVNPGRIVPATVEFVDIAGLVKGANEGEGLGNQFLANIRETDAICEVVRYFKDPNVMREVGRTGDFVDPAGDADTIMTELILADLGTLEKQLPKLEKDAKRDKELQVKLGVAKRLVDWLNDGKRAATMEMSDDERLAAKGLFLLTMKPILYVANVDEDMLGDELAPIDGVKPIPICAKVEAELSELDADEAAEYLSDLGLEKSGLAGDEGSHRGGSLAVASHGGHGKHLAHVVALEGLCGGLGRRQAKRDAHSQIAVAGTAVQLVELVLVSLDDVADAGDEGLCVIDAIGHAAISLSPGVPQSPQLPRTA